MSENLDVLVNRANLAMRGQPGFIACRVESSADRVLAYTFADHESAHLFQQQRALLDVPAVIHNSNQTVVFVTHT